MAVIRPYREWIVVHRIYERDISLSSRDMD